jgi:gamma-glutamyl:cysteine ligase YbdK (ATP-grasp superfamily)
VRIDTTSVPDPEEAAAVAAVLEALLASDVEGEHPAAPLSTWRLAARVPENDYDAGRALRRARRRAS